MLNVLMFTAVFKPYLSYRGGKTSLVKELYLIPSNLFIVLVFLTTNSLISATQYPNQKKMTT